MGRRSARKTRPAGPRRYDCAPICSITATKTLTRCSAKSGWSAPFLSANARPGTAAPAGPIWWSARSGNFSAPTFFAGVSSTAGPAISSRGWTRFPLSPVTRRSSRRNKNLRNPGCRLKISLVISTFNQPDALAKTWRGLARQTRWPDEVLLSDDGSGEPTRELGEQFAASSPVPVQHVWQPHDGFRKTIILNQTLAVATGDYLIFTDADCVPHPQIHRGPCRAGGKRFLGAGPALFCARGICAASLRRK